MREIEKSGKEIKRPKELERRGYNEIHVSILDAPTINTLLCILDYIKDIANISAKTKFENMINHRLSFYYLRTRMGDKRSSGELITR